MRSSHSHTKLSKNVIKKNVLGSHFKGKAAFSGSNSKFSTKSRFVCTSSLLMQSASSQLFFFTNLLGCLFFLSFAFFLSFFSVVEKLEKLHFCARRWRPEFFGPLQSWTIFFLLLSIGSNEQKFWFWLQLVKDSFHWSGCPGNSGL